MTRERVSAVVAGMMSEDIETGEDGKLFGNRRFKAALRVAAALPQLAN